MRGNSRILKHAWTGLKVIGTSERPYKVEVSLPRLIYKSNGYLIKSQSELDTAVSKLDRIKDQVVSMSDDSTSRITRIDIVGQIRCDVETFMVSHRNSPHPNFRSAGDVLKETLYFGSIKYRQVAIYDKGKESKSVAGEYLRFELRLKAKTIPQELRERLDYNRCYEELRRIMTKFDATAPRKSLKTDPERFAALFDILGDKGPEALAILLSGRTQSRQSQLKKATMEHVRAQNKINWKMILPKDPSQCQFIDCPKE